MQSIIFIIEKLNDNNNKSGFNVDFLGYLCYFKGILKIEQNICFKRNQIVKFDKSKIIFENILYITYVACLS